LRILFGWWKIENKIAVLIPVFNGEKFLDKTLENLINQEYKNFKVFICDDNSSDRSNKIIRAYLEILDITLVKNKKNMGISHSISRLVSLARNEFDIAIFLGQDDMLTSNYLKEIRKYFQNRKTVLVYSVLKQIDESGEKIRKNIAPVKINMFGSYKTAIMLHGNYVTSPGASFRIKSFPNRAVKNTPSLLHDWAQFLWTSLDSEIKISYKINVFYRVHKDQTTKKQKLLLTDVERLKISFVNSNSFKAFFSNLPPRSKHVFLKLYLILEGTTSGNSKISKMLMNFENQQKLLRPGIKLNQKNCKRLNINLNDCILLLRISQNYFLVIFSTLKFIIIILRKFILGLKYFI
jgi:glycosyltransferase involved in cell wall biosynthesis